MSAQHPLHIRRFVETLNATMAPSSVRSVYIVLRALLTSAVDAEVLAVSPCRAIRLPAQRPTAKAFLTPEAIDRLAAAVDPDYQPMIYLAAYLGLRWSEVAGLRVGRVDLRRATVSVAETNAYVGGFADVKSRSARRTIALPPFLAEMLAAHLTRRHLSPADTTALVFAAPAGGRLYANNWHRRVWAPAVAASGVGVTFHGLRHTSVGLMVATDTHPKVIQQRLGHSTWTTTMDIYGHVLPAVDDGVTTKLETLHTATRLNRPGSTGGSDLTRRLSYACIQEVRPGDACSGGEDVRGASSGFSGGVGAPGPPAGG